MSKDILDNNNGIIDDQPDGSSNSPKGHDVDCQSDRGDARNRRGERRRHNKKNHQADAPTAQEEENHHHRQHDTDKNAVACARDGTHDKVSLIVEILKMNTGRNTQLGHFRCYILSDLNGASGRLLDDINQDGIPPASRGTNILVRNGSFHLSHIRDFDGNAVLHSHGHRSDIIGSFEQTGNERKVELVVVVDQTR